jgi:heme/copper-type cytochrome/quinol oxidase subunit 3
MKFTFNPVLLTVRVLLSSKNMTSPFTATFYAIHTWSDSIFLNFLMKTQGFFGFLQQGFTNYIKNLMAYLSGQVTIGNVNLNYRDTLLSVEKYYIRKRLFGSVSSITTLAQFTQALNQEPTLSIGSTDIMGQVVPISEQVLVNQQTSYALFSPVVHYNNEHKTVFSIYSHPFHLVDPSPWPFCTSIGLWYLAFTTVAFFHNFLFSVFNIVFGLVYLALSLAFWWRDVIRESTYEFKHTPYVRRGLLTGMLLFIISEVMFFFGFFWAFFHASLAPSHMIGAVWPPATIVTISPWQLPLVNTLCLLLSGVTLTIAHRQLTSLPYYNQTVSLQWPLVRRLILWLQVTVFLGVFFLFCQGVEYYLSPFTFQDTVFGGTFYILTGLHGLHVLVGTIFLLVCLWRASRLHFTLWKQVGFKSAVWYWHFVDVVWIFLFIVIYIWGGLSS